MSKPTPRKTALFHSPPNDSDILAIAFDVIGVIRLLLASVVGSFFELVLNLVSPYFVHVPVLCFFFSALPLPEMATDFEFPQFDDPNDPLALVNTKLPESFDFEG